MQLSEHWSLADAEESATATRLGIDNSVPAEAAEHCRTTAAGLEQIQSQLQSQKQRQLKLRINSWYRSPELNAAIRGSKTSAHMEGLAADFTCPEFGTVLEIIEAILASEIEFDQLIYEGKWVHISFAPALRHQVLTAHFTPGGVSYSKGI